MMKTLILVLAVFVCYSNATFYWTPQGRRVNLPPSTAVVTSNTAGGQYGYYVNQAHPSYVVQSPVANTQYTGVAPAAYTAPVYAPLAYTAPAVAPVSYTAPAVAPVSYTAPAVAPVSYTAPAVAPVSYTAPAAVAHTNYPNQYYSHYPGFGYSFSSY